MNYETVVYEKKNRIGILTLNRPKQLNAISPRLALEVQEILEQANRDEESRVIIITGGNQCFCTGADIKALETNLEGRSATDIISSFLHGLDRFQKPMIAAISGYALGGGCEIAMGCDLRIASTTARFGLPEVKVGLIPAGGGTQRLPRIVGRAKAKELMFIGDFIDAQEACSIGLVNKVVPVESFMNEAMQLASVLARRPPLALEAIKKCINLGMEMSLASGLEYEGSWTERIMVSADAKEGMAAFVEKREPTFTGK